MGMRKTRNINNETTARSGIEGNEDKQQQRQRCEATLARALSLSTTYPELLAALEIAAVILDDVRRVALLHDVHLFVEIVDVIIERNALDSDLLVGALLDGAPYRAVRAGYAAGENGRTHRHAACEKARASERERREEVARCTLRPVGLGARSTSRGCRA